MFTCISPHHTLLVRIALQRTSYPLSLSSSTTHIHTHISLQDSLASNSHTSISRTACISPCVNTHSVYSIPRISLRVQAQEQHCRRCSKQTSLSLSLSLFHRRLCTVHVYTSRILSLLTHSLTHSLTLTYYSSSMYTHTHTPVRISFEYTTSECTLVASSLCLHSRAGF